MYTKMLGLPPLPWFVHLGRTGDRKSIIIWLQKQLVLELQDRVNKKRKEKKPTEPEDSVQEASDAAADAADDASSAKGCEASFTADTGTLYGLGPKMKGNGGRIFVTLHEGKPLLSKTLHDAPGVCAA